MMTNREKFRDELDNLLARIIAVVDGEPVRCWSASCKRCLFQDTCGKPGHKKKIIDWLNAEYQEPPVDWSKVPIDTPVLASADGKSWYRRHCAGTDDKGNPKVYLSGHTSWSTTNEEYISPEFVRLAGQWMTGRVSERIRIPWPDSIQGDNLICELGAIPESYRPYQDASNINANPKPLIGKAVFKPDNIGKQTVDVTFEHPLQSIPFAIMAIYNDTISVVDYMGVLNVVKDSVTKNGFQVSTKRLAAEYNWEITYVVYYWFNTLCFPQQPNITPPDSTSWCNCYLWLSRWFSWKITGFKYRVYQCLLYGTSSLHDPTRTSVICICHYNQTYCV